MRGVLLLLVLTIPGALAAQDISVRQSNDALLNQALAPYRLTLSGANKTQVDGLGRAFRELVGDVSWDSYRINGLQATAIAHYGLTLYGGVQLSIRAGGDTASACPEPSDCGRAAMAAAALYTALQKPPSSTSTFSTFNSIMNGDNYRPLINDLYLAANRLVLATRRCNCAGATADAERLREKLRTLTNTTGIVSTEDIAPQIALAANILERSTDCVGAAGK